MLKGTRDPIDVFYFIAAPKMHKLDVLADGSFFVSKMSNLEVGGGLFVFSTMPPKMDSFFNRYRSITVTEVG